MMREGHFAFHMETGAGYKIVRRYFFDYLFFPLNQIVDLHLLHQKIAPVNEISVETFEEHEKCGLQEIQFLQVSDPWMAIQKNTSYKEMLKIG